MASDKHPPRQPPSSSLPSAASSDARRQWVLASKVIARGYLALGRDPVVIGRARDCTLPIFHDSISRTHARVSRQGHRWIVEDLGSTNGTFVQGKKIHGATFLEHDHLIHVGSVELRFLALDLTREQLAERFDPRAADTSVLEPTRSASGAATSSGALLAGEFTTDVLLQVCQLIEVNHHTGVLRIESKRDQGEVRFRDGAIVGARFGTARGEKAARTLLRLPAGAFAFRSAAVEDQKGEEPTKLSANALALDILHEQARKRGEPGDGFLDQVPDVPPEKLGDTVSILERRRRPGPPSDRTPRGL